MELVNGNIVNENDEIVGKYYHILGTLYSVTIYGNREELTKEQLVSKLDRLELYAEPVWG